MYPNDILDEFWCPYGLFIKGHQHNGSCKTIEWLLVDIWYLLPVVP